MSVPAHYNPINHFELPGQLYELSPGLQSTYYGLAVCLWTDYTIKHAWEIPLQAQTRSLISTFHISVRQVEANPLNESKCKCVQCQMHEGVCMFLCESAINECAKD